MERLCQEKPRRVSGEGGRGRAEAGVSPPRAVGTVPSLCAALLTPALRVISDRAVCP